MTKTKGRQGCAQGDPRDRRVEAARLTEVVLVVVGHLGDRLEDQEVAELEMVEIREVDPAEVLRGLLAEVGRPEEMARLLVVARGMDPLGMRQQICWLMLWRHSLGRNRPGWRLTVDAKTSSATSGSAWGASFLRFRLSHQWTY